MKIPGEQQWRTLNELLDELLELEPGARKRRLESVACQQPELLKPLNRLLASVDRTDMIDTVLSRALHFLADQQRLPQPQRVGVWQLDSEIGRGGMAQVFLAARADGAFEQKAALKLLWPGMANANVLARFEQERQILANLDDPRIARLIDGGIADDGRPWLAMEYVEGLPVDRYCEQHGLAVEQRLALFCEIAAAVGAAHRRLVVHRDIKPANVLISTGGQVKLLDFGIAKLLDEDAMPYSAPTTRRADRLLTPEYASPEQLTGSSMTTASDIYQLGALLFQLLTGQPPHRRRGLSTAEFESRILSADPPRPSLRAAAQQREIAVRHARSCGLSRSALIQKLRGDLDAIIMKTLRREPQRRYDSVAQLVDDVNNHLNGLPVRACPESLRYRITRFTRRHRIGIGIAALFMTLLVAYATTVTWQASQLAHQRDQVRIEAVRAERVKDLLLGLFEAADPYGDKGIEVTAGELLAAGAEQIRNERDLEPALRAEMLGTLGDVLMGLAAHDRAEDLVSEALALQRELHAADHPDLARAISRYGALRGGLGDPQSEERYATQALAMRQRLYGPEHETVAGSLGQLAAALTYQARYEQAMELFRQAIDMRRRLGLAADESTARLWNDLGVTLDYAGRRDESRAAHGKALAIRRGLFAPGHLAIAESLNNLALTLSNLGRLDEAEPLYREALETRRQALGGDHPRVAVALHNLGLLLRRAGELDEAEAVHREALEIRRGFAGGVNSNTAMSLQALADIARDRGATNDAGDLYQDALSVFRATVGERHPRVGWAAVGLGRNLLAQGRVEEAETLLDEGVTILQERLGGDSGITGQARIALGLCRVAQGRDTEARWLIESGLIAARASATSDPKLIAEGERALSGLQDVAMPLGPW